MIVVKRRDPPEWPLILFSLGSVVGFYVFLFGYIF
jgi:hypothetical protein